MIHACVRTDNMSGTLQGKDLVTLRYEKEIDNGCVLAIGAHLPGEREVREGSIPASDAKAIDCALIASEEVLKDKTHNNLKEFYNEADANLRGYRLTSKDVFSVTKEAFSGAPAVGKRVGFDGSSVKWAVVEDGGVGEIILQEGQWFVVEID